MNAADNQNYLPRGPPPSGLFGMFVAGRAQRDWAASGPGSSVERAEPGPGTQSGVPIVSTQDTTSNTTRGLQNWFAGATAAELDKASEAILTLQAINAAGRAADACAAAQVVAQMGRGGRDAK